MYSNETLKKFVGLLNSTKQKYDALPVDEIKLCISKGNSKIGRVMNVSLPPILTCANCKECKHLCYDIKACLFRTKDVLDARIRNLVILTKDRDEYFRRIEQAISRRHKNKFFRWHVAGDIVDIDYFDRMVKIADEHSDFVFWTYTKNYKVVNAWIDEHGKDKLPSNLSVMFSEWRGVKMVNPYNFPEFRVVFKGEQPPKGFYCPGNCDICKAGCRGCVARETVYCMEH